MFELDGPQVLVVPFHPLGDNTAETFSLDAIDHIQVDGLSTAHTGQEISHMLDLISTELGSGKFY